MVRIVEDKTGWRSDPISVEEFVALFKDMDIPPQDEDAMLSAAPLLHRLNNNKTFLGEMILEEMLQDVRSQEGSAYSAQVVMLATISSDFFVRANFWPAQEDEVVKKTGSALFAYGQPHDHNFSFLTSGYFGPGYESDYYVYDRDAYEGYIGETVELTFTQTSFLSEGKIQLYRAHKDVHVQKPPKSLSVSLNIMDSSPSFRDQFLFSNDLKSIERVAGIAAAWPTLDAAAAMLGEEAVAPLLHVAARHRDPSTRFHALKAAANVLDEAGAAKVMEVGINSESKMVAAWSRRYVDWLAGEKVVALAREF
ncbi:hypothetical protein [Caulobacter sp. 1776]|uniref:hypothetical protein n=1 Tax=Caulobacter sp. 1776 TaxID=3156420 RepID=UPI003395251B